MKIKTKLNLTTGLLASGILMTSAATAAVSALGLEGYYTFDTAAVVDSSSAVGGAATNNTGAYTGTGAFDSTGNLLGTSAVVGDAAGSDFLTVTGSDYNFGTGSFSVVLWLNLKASVGGDPSYASAGGKNWSGSGGSQGWNMAMAGDDYDGNVADGAARRDPAIIDIDPGANNWALMSLVVDRSANTVSMYALDFNVTTIGDDASAATTADITGLGSFTNNGDIVFGQDGDGAGYSIPLHEIDDVSIWSRSLNQSEIQEIYTAGRAGNNLSTVLTPVPEPSSTALLGLGGLALILRRRK